MIVVDASLMVKSLFGEVDWEAAVTFLDSHRGKMVAPDLLLTEVAGAIVRRVNQREGSESEGRDMLANWLAAWRDGLIQLHRLDAGQLGRATRLAMRIGHPLADCIYLSLAMELRCPLATCDARFRDKALPVHPEIKLLDEFD
ncbi:PIN domain-containing protein [Sphingomonas gilva]|uniref:PIN domain-containing protein n=1 Tax=Sphingomonas gilva TaxID=2305907 RepID=A0A396RKI9_9SPHN|nr:type II toxin-antitoxin system VapC family toxin [Sphingomonas gilva]RHW16768.1 PIN domain-containing protein [Sphingomonas gilva]